MHTKATISECLSLSNAYQGNNKSKFVTSQLLTKDIENFQMECDSMTHTMSLVNQIRNNGYTLED
jgi:hypothetical protein